MRAPAVLMLVRGSVLQELVGGRSLLGQSVKRDRPVRSTCRDKECLSR